ncbi:hypothetical protein AAVH_24332 [Aphelenchoides avenae]|nr:hypothetical protein AAVH_24332 [Aphelenchus avenae]
MSTNDVSESGATSDRKRAEAFVPDNSSRSPSPKRAKSAKDNHPGACQKPPEDSGCEGDSEASLKKVALVEICDGAFMYGDSTPASLLVRRQQGEPKKKFYSLAALDGCIFVGFLVRKFAKKKHISVHVDTLIVSVKATVMEHTFKEMLMIVRDLANALASVRRIVWVDFWKHCLNLKQYRHTDWFRDYRLPVPLEVDGASGMDLIELLHRIHPNGGNSTAARHVYDTACGKILEAIQKFLRNDGAGSGIGSFKCTFSTMPAGRYGSALDKSVVTDFASAVGATMIDTNDGSIKFHLVEGNHEMHVVYEFKKNEDPNYGPRNDSDDDDSDAEPESSEARQRRQE